VSEWGGYGWRLGSGLSIACLYGWWVFWGPWSSLFVRFCDLQSVHKNIWSGFECHSPGRHHCLSSFRDIVLRPLSWSSIFTDLKLKHRDTTQCRRPHSSEVEHTGREIYPWWYSVFLTWKFWHTRLRSKWYKIFKLNMFGGVRVFDSDASGSSPGYGHNPNPWDHDYHQKWHVTIFTARRDDRFAYFKSFTFSGMLQKWEPSEVKWAYTCTFLSPLDYHHFHGTIGDSDMELRLLRDLTSSFKFNRMFRKHILLLWVLLILPITHHDLACGFGTSVTPCGSGVKSP